MSAVLPVPSPPSLQGPGFWKRALAHRSFLIGAVLTLVGNLLAFVAAMAVMVLVAWLIERLVLGKLVNQEGITLLMATLGITYFLDGFGQTIFGSDIYKIDIGMPKDPVFIFESAFEGGVLVNKEDVIAAVIAAARGAFPGRRLVPIDCRVVVRGFNRR